MKDILPSINFYYKIVFKNSLEDYMNTFLSSNFKYINEGFTYYQPMDYYIKDDLVIDDGINSVFITKIITREDYLQRWLNDNSRLLLSEIYEIKSNNEILNENLLHLKDFFDLIFKNEKTNNFEILRNHFLNIIHDLESLNLHKKIGLFNDLILRLGDGEPPFLLKEGYNKPFLHKLYDFMLSVNLIDEDLYEETFINIFRGLTREKILFQKDTYHIVYFLDSIKPFFENLTSFRIEETKLLYTTNRIALNVSSLNTSRSRLKKDESRINEEFKFKIEDFLDDNLN